MSSPSPRDPACAGAPEGAFPQGAPTPSLDLLTAVPEVAGLLEEEPEPQSADGQVDGLWAVIFAGGIGTRFWPLSTARRPKPVLALVHDRPLIAETVQRLAPMVPPTRVLVVTSADIADTLHAAIPDVPRANLLVEPRPLGTAAALAWGATAVMQRAGPETPFCALHADLSVADPAAFRQAVRRAMTVATAEDVLVTLGVRPTRPETGFGYLHPGAPLDPLQVLAEGGAHRVAYMVEKPDATQAERLIAQGALWHSGIGVWRTRVVLDALTQHTREVAPSLPLLAAGALEQFAREVTSISVDRGLLERSDRVVVLPVSMGWDDVGTWAALRRIRELDDTGNGLMGEVHCVESSGNVLHAEGQCIVAYGISGMLVVSLHGLTFVTPLERATDLGPLLNALPGSLRFNPGRNGQAG